MRFKKPLIISLAAIALGTYLWRSYLKPLSGRLYAQAVVEYKNGNYKRSLELLNRAYRIDPLDTGILTLAGWNYLRLRKIPEAVPRFSRALWLNPSLGDARMGLAYCWLEVEDGGKALEHFSRLPAEDRHSTEVRMAMARAHRLAGENERALRVLEGLLQQDPQDKLALRELAYLTGAENLASLADTRSMGGTRSPELAVAARLRDGYFEIPQRGSWTRIYVAGVDIGPATPGHFATEPPIELSTYLSWLEKIGAMGANCVRVYTLMPPGFYRALLAYNDQHPQYPLHLFQEIWLKDPPLDNLFDQGFTEDFEKEIRDVVDSIHGQSSLPIQKYHAGGIFSADVSPYVLGWLIGREIEPRLIITTNLRNPGVSSFEGHYLRIADGSPSEVWLTRMCDTAVEYEVSKYNWQRPVCFVNWPPLDPLSHPTEAPLAEELRVRRAQGEKLAPLGLGVQDDFDVVSLDEEKVSPQPNFQAGYFGLYHVYPFWPDFIFLDPVYRTAKDEQGPNFYWGYLTDLKRHLQRTPLLVGEYGLSTSMGIAHFNPNGWNHGGLNESQQGEALLRLTRNIQKAGCAGGLIFEWLDEWWKHNWIAVDFEKPFDRKALWHNDMDPEQSFGLMKFIPEEPPPYTTLAEAHGSSSPAPGQPDANGPPPLHAIRTASDPAALYVDILLDLRQSGEPDWSQHHYLLALNTCDAPCGSSALPFVSDVRVADGANFLVDFGGPESCRLLVARSYNPYRELPVEGVPAMNDLVVPRDLRTGMEADGPFEELIVETNRRRVGRDATFYPGSRYSRSSLHYGAFDPTARDYDSLGQCYFDRAAWRIRLRLSWGLLLVLDPSQGLVFDGTDEQGKTIGKVSRQIRMAAVAYRRKNDAAKGVLAQIMAKQVTGQVITGSWSMLWPTWSAVRYKEELKQSYPMVASAFAKLTGYPSVAGGR